MSDEEDYMSDAFLLKCQDKTNTLTGKKCFAKGKRNNGSQQQNSMKLTVNQKPVKRSKLEANYRDEALDKHINEDNKGFQLLVKLGFTPGTSLGKSGTGIKTPIDINVKSNRIGLGRKEFIKKLKSKRIEIITNSLDDFRKRASNKADDNLKMKDLLKSQKACRQLDLEFGEKSPVLHYFWPEDVKQKLLHDDYDIEKDSITKEISLKEDEEAKIDEEKPSVEEMLDKLTDYLQSVYLYCIWCATKYEDFEDMKVNCAGNSSQLHEE